MAEFTPGPWKVVRARYSNPFDPDTVFSVGGPPSDFFYLRKEADANLIAAAPDLYEALAEMVGKSNHSLRMTLFCDCCEEWVGPCGEHPHADECVLLKAKAALAKAKGESE